MNIQYILLVMSAVAAVYVVVSLLFRSAPGKKGEKKASRKLHGLNEEYTVLDDITIPSEYGTTQIDHVVVSRYGIFVIETKDYGGRISGHEDMEYWTQSLYGRKYEMRNPIRQNIGHVLALRKVTEGLPYVPFIPIVAFTKRAELALTCYSGNATVVYIKKLRAVIMKYEEAYLDDDDVEDYVEAIRTAASSLDEIEVKRHKKAVKRYVKDRAAVIREGVCPRCGGYLIKKKGKFGYFYGCSNFPDCRFLLAKK